MSDVPMLKINISVETNVLDFTLATSDQSEIVVLELQPNKTYRADFDPTFGFRIREKEEQ